MKGEMAAGNGAAMRAAPLAFCLDPGDSEARRTIRDVCRITHHNEDAYVGALAVVLAVRFASEATWVGSADLIDMVRAHLPDSSVRDRLAELAQLPSEVEIGEVAMKFGSSGYVVESVPLALYAAQRVKARGLERMLHDVVSAGGDTDTTGSMSGQIAGALLGRTGLSSELIDRLPQLEMIEGIVREFSEVVSKTRG
jgi:ADP-ribosylglycohydrolase